MEKKKSLDFAGSPAGGTCKGTSSEDVSCLAFHNTNGLPLPFQLNQEPQGKNKQKQNTPASLGNPARRLAGELSAPSWRSTSPPTPPLSLSRPQAPKYKRQQASFIFSQFTGLLIMISSC